MAEERRTGTRAEGQGDRPRASIHGLAEDIEQMFRHLIRERNEARAHVAMLERELMRRARLPRSQAVPSIDLGRAEIDPAFLEILPAEMARKHRVLPLRVSRVFIVAMADPSDRQAIEEISARTGFVVQPVAATDAALADALDRYYGPPGSGGVSARRAVRGTLRLVWSRADSPGESGRGGTGGGRPAA